MIYLFVGQDSPAKDSQLAKLKAEHLPQEVADFNLDVLYAAELNLPLLQERVLQLPVRAKKRLILIRQAERLKEPLKEFILKEIKNLPSGLILILDINRPDPKDSFLRQVSRLAKTFYFSYSRPANTFDLSRQIDNRRPDRALGILNQLLADGERPERIMGGLRYAWEKDTGSPQELKKRLKALLNCDIEIKRGRLRPELALEKLVVSLCAFT